MNSSLRPPGFGTRFQKGRSGNPNGRPRKIFEAEPSAFEIIFDREIVVTVDGETNALSAEEALQQKLYNDAKQTCVSRAENESRSFQQRRILAISFDHFRESALRQATKSPFSVIQLGSAVISLSALQQQSELRPTLRLHRKHSTGHRRLL